MTEFLSEFYAAASGRLEWAAPLRTLSDKLGLWAAQLVGVDKKTGQLNFSVEGGPVPPQAALDYVRHYHAINPRLTPAIATPLGKWMHCHEHFDDTYVAKSAFYQDFLIPHGGRYLTSMKLVDNADTVFMLGLMRGVGSRPFTSCDDEMLRSIQYHGGEALRNFIHLRETFAESGLAQHLLAQFQYPMLLVDETRGIWHQNTAAHELLDRGDVVIESRGSLKCWDAPGDLMLTELIHELSEAKYIGAPTNARRVLNLLSERGERWLAFLSWVSPDSAMGSFGSNSRALITLHNPLSEVAALDPFILAECFDLTPAEAKVAVQIAAGACPKQIAKRLGSAIPTIRTHIRHVFEKTGVDRQVDLIRILLSLPFHRVR